MTRRLHTFMFTLLMLWIMLLSLQSFAQTSFNALVQVKVPLKLRKTPSFSDTNNIVKILKPGDVLSVVNTVSLGGMIHYQVKDASGNEGFVYNDPRFVKPYTSSQVINTSVSAMNIPQAVIPPQQRRLYTGNDIGLLMPICGCVGERCRMSSPFGYRKDPKHGRRAMHLGVDLAGPYGTPIYAMADGYVHKDTGMGYNGGWGNRVVLTHSQPLRNNQGTLVSISGFRTEYAHMQKIAVKDGQRVRKGQVIGYMGSSGRSTGSHTHINLIANDKYQDPYKFFDVGSVKYSNNRVHTTTSCPAQATSPARSSGTTAAM